jgi:hypothetical protein
MASDHLEKKGGKISAELYQGADETTTNIIGHRLLTEAVCTALYGRRGRTRVALRVVHSHDLNPGVDGDRSLIYIHRYWTVGFSRLACACVHPGDKLFFAQCIQRVQCRTKFLIRRVEETICLAVPRGWIDDIIGLACYFPHVTRLCPT